MGISKRAASNSTQPRVNAPVKSGPSSRTQSGKTEGNTNRGTLAKVGMQSWGKAR